MTSVSAPTAEEPRSSGAATLRGKTLFITGASRGIGKAIALRAARDGANVVIAAKTAEPHPKLPGTIYTAAEEIEKAGGKALACVVDIRDEEQIAAAVAEAVAKFGGIDILVNNASAISLTGTLETPMKRYDLMHQINTRGTFACSQACMPHLLKAENPHILNLSPPLNMEERVVRAARGLHDGEVRDEHVRARHGRRVPRRGHRRQRALAAHRHRDGGGAEPARRRRRSSAAAARRRSWPTRRTRSSRGRAASAPATSSSTTTCLREAGVTDFEQYKTVRPGPTPILPDFFL